MPQQDAKTYFFFYFPLSSPPLPRPSSPLSILSSCDLSVYGSGILKRCFYKFDFIPLQPAAAVVTNAFKTWSREAWGQGKAAQTVVFSLQGFSKIPNFFLSDESQRCPFFLLLQNPWSKAFCKGISVQIWLDLRKNPSCVFYFYFFNLLELFWTW